MKNIENIILEKLNLSPDDVESLTPVPSDDGSDNFLLILKRKDHICPYCGSITNKIKDYKPQKIRNKIFSNSNTTVIYRCRRYYCPNCYRSFVEKQTFTGSRKALAPSVIDQVLKALKPYNSTFSSVARQFDLSVTSVVDIFDKHVQMAPNPLPSVMCWDEFYFNRHARNKYAFMMLNFRNKAIIDILESRKASFLSDYFFKIPKSERNKVNIIIIDMNDYYRNIANIYFPESKLCIDSFHITKYFNDELNRIRKKIMKRFSSDKTSTEYRLLKYRRHLLFRHQTDVDYINQHYDRILGYHTADRNVLKKILDIDSNLDRAYELKEQYIDFNTVEEDNFVGLEAKSKELDQLIKACIESNIQSMIKCGNLLSRWYTEILNSFGWVDHRRLSNGPIEGKNSYVKKILGNANGFSNFERARNKIMYSQNHNATYSITEHEKPVKRKGKPRGKYNKNRTK